MREQRIVCVLSELSSRVAEYNTTMEMLQDDFNHSRRASMQIRKAAQKCINHANVVMCRFIDIANSIGMNEDCAMMETFHRRRVVFNHYEQYFKWNYYYALSVGEPNGQPMSNYYKLSWDTEKF